MKTMKLFTKIFAKYKKTCYNTIVGEKPGKGEVKMYDVTELSNYVLNEFNLKSSPITNLKLQKILYYVQGYFYYKFNRPAFDDDIVCWTYGPVVPIVYYEHSCKGGNELKATTSSKIILNAGEEKLIKSIINKCIDISSFRLVEMTHSESPWMNARKRDIISKESIASFFKEKDPLSLWKN